MKYFLDTEFNSFGGELISLALVREDGVALYVTYDQSGMQIHEWVRENVIPILVLDPIPQHVMQFLNASPVEAAVYIKNFLDMDPQKLPIIVADWPEDVAYLARALITGPGTMAKIDRIVFDYVNVDSWFQGKWLHGNTPEAAVQHNAYWDACALRAVFIT